ncbi:MAG: hypothetical protein KME13_21545 [Myxacorys californica WJT36-NPBG1]|jgi:hypothetical protein|nr:hypothetical protein [Myxacorys californica WJT36-NPBG1]
MARYFHNDWVSYHFALPFGGGTLPDVAKYFLCLADTTLLTRASSRADFIAAELLQQNGYARSQLLFSDPGSFSNSNKRYDAPLVTGDFEADGGALQFQTVFLIANGHATANKTLTDASVNAATNVITATAHGLINGNEVIFSVQGGSTLPTGVAANTIYKVMSVATDSFQISTDGVTAIDITSTGAGTFYLRYVPARIVLLDVLTDPRLLQDGKPYSYDLYLAGMNTTYGVGV